MKNFFILMRPLWTEMIANLGQGMGASRAKRKKTNKQRPKSVTILLVIFIFGMLIFYSSMIGIGVTKNLMIIGAADMYIRMVSIAAPIFVLIFGVLQAIPTMYHESSIESLLVLPVKPATITAAKLTQAFVPILLIATAFLYPSLIAHGVMTHRPWAYYLQTIPFMLLVTVAPFAVIALFVLVMMRYTKLARNKDRFQLVTSIVTILLIVGFSFLVNMQTSLGNFDTGGIFSNPATSAIIGNLVKYLPTSAFSTAMLINAHSWNSMTYGLMAFGINVVAVALLLLVANKIYIRGVLGVKGSKKVKRLTEEQTIRELAPRSAYRALISKEWKLLLRTPAFFTQTIFFALFMPLFMIGTFAFSFSRTNGMADASSNLVGFLRQQVASGMWQDSFWIIVLVVGSVATFFSGTTLVSASAISRQGATFSYSKVIPVPLRTQVFAWLTPGFSLMLLIWVVLTVGLAIILQMPLHLALIVFFIAMVNCYFIQLLGFWTDMKAPVLNWSNEMEAVKNTRASLVSSLGNIVYIGLAVALAFLVRTITGKDPMVTGLVIIAFYVLVAVLTTILVKRTASRLFQTVEL